MRRKITWLLAFVLAGFVAIPAHAQSAKTLVEQSAQAMGGMAGLRAVKTID